MLAEIGAEQWASKDRGRSKYDVLCGLEAIKWAPPGAVPLRLSDCKFSRHTLLRTASPPPPPPPPKTLSPLCPPSLFNTVSALHVFTPKLSFYMR